METTGAPDDFIEQAIFGDASSRRCRVAQHRQPVSGGQLEYEVDFAGRVTAYRDGIKTLGSGRLVGKVYYDVESASTIDKAGGTSAAFDRRLHRSMVLNRDEPGD